uniref:tRNA (adenine(58)-N(1))-methyltransferase n=1 Tax=Neogobius melanostomus TaxID=47308 RepID=A0A8C6V1Y6_9GOBI
MSLRTLFMYRLLRLRALRNQCSIEMFSKVTQTSRQDCFTTTNCVNRVENDDTTFSRVLLPRRRSLSPLERVSSLLPQDSLTPEVEELRRQDQHHLENGPPRLFDNEATHSNEEETRFSGIKKGGQISDCASSEVAENQCNGASYQPKGETLLTFGEVLVAEYRKKGNVEFRKMFQLLARTRLQSSWGVILHEDIAGKPAGSFVKTNLGVSILIRRASLEDYVLFMKRGPAIAYPKVPISAMLMMMDITEGDCVLEAGSGSGAMSLFLSRAVGASGRVMSVDVREDHLKRAVLNYNRWRTSWELRRGQPWPNNVEFVQANLCTATSVLQGQEFHAVALDLIHPHLVLPIVIPHLHSGAVCTIYLAKCVRQLKRFPKMFIQTSKLFLFILKHYTGD